MAPPALHPAVARAYVPSAPKTPRGACVTPVPPLPCCTRCRARLRLTRVLIRQLDPPAPVNQQQLAPVTRHTLVPTRLARFHKASYISVDKDAAGAAPLLPSCAESSAGMGVGTAPVHQNGMAWSGEVIW